MFYDIAAKIFKWRHVYIFTYAPGQALVYDIVFAKDYKAKSLKGVKPKSTKSWKKAKRWFDNGHDVVPIGIELNTRRQEVICGEITDYDINRRTIELNCGRLIHIGRFRRSRKWR